MKTKFQRSQTYASRSIMISLLAAFCVSNASAALLGGSQGFPRIAFKNDVADSGNQTATTYNAASKAFTVIADPASIKLSATAPVVLFAEPDSLSINIQVKNDGTLMGGILGPDLIITDATGDVLTGEIIDFGYKNTASGDTDSFDFHFTVTGGSQASAYGQSSLVVTLTSENSNFDGNFNVDFGGDSKGNVGTSSALGDTVWIDANGDGLQNEVDAGVAGVIVNLYQDNGDRQCVSGEEGTVFRSTQTNTDGLYLFDFLPVVKLIPGPFLPVTAPIEYCVEFVKPDGYDFTLQDQGTDNALDSDASPTTGMTALIGLAAGEVDLTWDAGLIQKASLGDFVWNDINEDGIQDTDELGIVGVNVKLYGCDAASGDINTSVLASQLTGIDGYYEFADLLPGNYVVEFIAPSDSYSFSPFNNAGDETKDSDVVNFTGLKGQTACITLPANTHNPDIDAGLYEPKAGFGDRVWEDKNADGIQDDGEMGLPGVEVKLLFPGNDGFCNTDDDFDSGTFTTTDDTGKYEFTNLQSGTYCAQVQLPVDLCAFGLAKFSMPFRGTDGAKDSDVDSDTGISSDVKLAANEFNPDIDAGIYCPAELGDTLWLDTNENGIQDSVESGVPGQLVTLLDCGLNELNPPVSTTTDGSGKYLFDKLMPGSYIVKFSKPGDHIFSPINEGDNDELDSDVNSNGETACITLDSQEQNLTVDAGIFVPAVCDVSVDKTCAIISPAPLLSDFVCSDAKPIDTLTMISGESATIDSIAVYSSTYDPSNPANNLMNTINGPIEKDGVVTASGYAAAGAGNDVEWLITYEDGSQAVSRFHRSCSDVNMNDASDCGKLEGNSKKDTAGLLNTWLFEGMAGNGAELQCTPPVPTPVAGSDECSFETPAAPHCLGKVQNLSLRYLGGGCVIEPNSQEGRATCTGDSVGEPVDIIVSDGGSKVYLNATAVQIGDVITASAAIAGVNDFGSNTVAEIFSETGNLMQTMEIHTSCSKPLNLGDQFGSLEVVGLDTSDGGNVSLGAEVQLSYTVSNNSNGSFQALAVDDDLGTIERLLAPGMKVTETGSRFIIPGSTDEYISSVAVTGSLIGTGKICEAQDSAIVKRVMPTAPATPVTCSDIKPLTELSMVWEGAPDTTVTTAANEVFENLQPGNLITFAVSKDLYGNDFVVRLSGGVTGESVFHLSCSDGAMNGSEDCGSNQGDNKDNDPSLVNTWVLDGMTGETGSFACDVPNTGVVNPADGSVANFTDGGGVLNPTGNIVADPTGVILTKNELKWSLTNNSSTHAYVTEVAVTWPNAQGNIKELKFGADKFGDHLNVAPSSHTFTGVDFVSDMNKRKLDSGKTEEFKIRFHTDYEGDVAGDYTVTLTFDTGDVVSFDGGGSSIPTTTDKIIADIAGPVLTKNEFKWELTNNGPTDAYATEVALTWPNAQGNIKELKFGADKFGDKLNVAPSSHTFTGADFVSDMNKRKLDSGKTDEFKIRFHTDYDGDIPSDYTVTITFDTGDVVSFNTP